MATGSTDLSSSSVTSFVSSPPGGGTTRTGAGAATSFPATVIEICAGRVFDMTSYRSRTFSLPVPLAPFAAAFLSAATLPEARFDSPRSPTKAAFRSSQSYS